MSTLFNCARFAIATFAVMSSPLVQVARADGVPTQPKGLILQLNRSRWTEEVPGVTDLMRQMGKQNPSSHLVHGIFGQDASLEQIFRDHPESRIRGLVLAGPFDLESREIDELLASLQTRFARQLNLILLSPRVQARSKPQAQAIAYRLLKAAGADGSVTFAKPNPLRFMTPGGEYAGPLKKVVLSTLAGFGVTVFAQNFSTELFDVGSLLSAGAVYAVFRKLSANPPLGPVSLAVPAVLASPLLVEQQAFWFGGDCPVQAAALPTMLGGAACTVVVHNLLQALSKWRQQEAWEKTNEDQFLNMGWRIYVKNGRVLVSETVYLARPRLILDCESDLMRGGR